MQGGPEAPQELLRVWGDQVVQVADMSGHEIGVGGAALGQEDPLHRVEPLKGPWFQVAAQAVRVLQQPQVQECLVALVGQVGDDDRFEELRILECQEQIEFMAGVLRVGLELLLCIEGRPSQDEGEFAEVRVIVQRLV